MKKVMVSAEALREVLQALAGNPYEIRELQAIRKLGNSPIDKLISEYNAAVIEFNTKEAGPAGLQISEPEHEA